jgi:hypothetical protein
MIYSSIEKAGLWCLPGLWFPRFGRKGGGIMEWFNLR